LQEEIDKRGLRLEMRTDFSSRDPPNDFLECSGSEDGLHKLVQSTTVRGKGELDFLLWNTVGMAGPWGIRTIIS
jgi:hypothetical protein